MQPNLINKTSSSSSGWKADPSERPENPSVKGGFLQRNPLFGQEFPTLGSSNSNTLPSSSSSSDPNHDHKSHAIPHHIQQRNSTESEKYGPGPSLRPQISGSWMQGGSSGGGGSGVQQQQQQSNAQQQPNSVASVAETDSFTREKTESFREKIAPPIFENIHQSNQFGFNKRKDRQQNSSQQQPPPRMYNRGVGGSGSSGGHHHHHSTAKPLFQTSIIDNEKLRRMDYIEANEDDWTRSDDNFDYNKKLAR